MLLCVATVSWKSFLFGFQHQILNIFLCYLFKNQSIDDIPSVVLDDCAQLVKANSIEGNKINNVEIVYTPVSNLKKTANMDIGQIGFHKDKDVKTIKIEKRINEIVNRLNKTEIERKKPDLKVFKYYFYVYFSNFNKLISK